jgi:mono/diheme cytochrome c family protein
MRIAAICLGVVVLGAASSLVPSLLANPQEASGGGAKMPGQSVYEDTCSRCHGVEGRDGKAPSLVPFRWNYAQAIDIVRHGGACGMPSFKESELSDDEVKQIVDYMKTLN